MDIDQLAKRLEWLDEERRKDKLLISTMQDRIADLEEHWQPFDARLKEIEGGLARIGTSLMKFDQVDTAIAQAKQEFGRSIIEIEKQRNDRNREMDKVRLADLESAQKAMGDLRKSLDVLPDMKKNLAARLEGENRLETELHELEHKLTLVRRSDEEYRRQVKLLEDGQHQDSKRLADVQGEMGALRKRQEEQRGKMDLNVESLRKFEMRLSEMQAAESERRQSQIAFMEKQNMSALERERVWKEWQTRFDQIEDQSGRLDAQLQSLEATNRAVKRSQEAFDEITSRFERRINEITEMQRLVEDRFRQEWVSFKADDQKRWTNYTLAQEEQQREVSREINRVDERLVFLEDVAQELQDLVHQLTEENVKRLQGMLALYRSWAEEQEEATSRNRV